MTKERKELIVLDGITILFIVVIIINGVVLALFYRWHNSQVFKENLRNRAVYGELLAESRRMKNLLVDREGAESWEKSTYGKVLAFHERGKKTYVMGGIAMDYPSDYVSEMAKEGKHLVLMTREEADRLRDPSAPASEGPTTITIDTYSLEGKSITEWMKTSKDTNFNLGNGEYKTVKVGEVDALVFHWSGLYEAMTYAVQGSSGDVVLLTVTYITRSDEIVRDFDLILSTVRKSES